MNIITIIINPIVYISFRFLLYMNLKLLIHTTYKFNYLIYTYTDRYVDCVLFMTVSVEWYLVYVCMYVNLLMFLYFWGILKAEPIRIPDKSTSTFGPPPTLISDRFGMKRSIYILFISENYIFILSFEYMKAYRQRHKESITEKVTK